MRIPVTFTAVALALGVVALANAQVYKPSGGGGSSSITAGTTATSGCGAAGVLFSQSSLVQCDTGFTYAGTGGAVALTGILSIPDTTGATVGVLQLGGARWLHDFGGSSNVFVGHNAANFTTTGTNNVAVGESSGLSLAAGASNTFVGRFAGGSVAGGANNTCIGVTACASLASGSNNTVIGGAVTLGAAQSNAIALGLGSGVIEADFAITTAATWTFNGALAATLATAVGTNVVCNTPGTKTALTVQVSATGCAASSARFKEGIASLNRQKALDDVLKFEPVSYFYKPEFDMGKDLHVGFTAEQIGSVDPQWITYEDDGFTPHAVKYNEMAPLLAAAIQQLKADNDNLRAELEDLKRRVR